MNIYFAHGPWDGIIKFMHLRARSIFVASIMGNMHHYRRTPRYTQDGARIYIHLGTVREKVLSA